MDPASIKAAKKAAKRSKKLMKKLSKKGEESTENKENIDRNNKETKQRAARQGACRDNFQYLDEQIFSKTELMAMDDIEQDAAENSPEFVPSSPKKGLVHVDRTEVSSSDDESLPDPEKSKPPAKKFKGFVPPLKKNHPGFPAVPKLTIREGKKVDITDGAGANVSSLLTKMFRPKGTPVDMTFSSGKLNLRT